MSPSALNRVDLQELLLISGLVAKKTTIKADGTTINPAKFDLEPLTFLRHADLDLESNEMMRIISAQTNIKKSITCAMEIVLRSFSICTPKGNFFLKAKAIESLRIMVPKAVYGIIKAKNSSEHDFTQPDRTIVETALECAENFVPTIYDCLTNCPNGFYLSNDGAEKVIVHISRRMNGRFWLAKYYDEVNDKLYLSTITVENLEHRLLSSLVISLGRSDLIEAHNLFEILLKPNDI